MQNQNPIDGHVWLLPIYMPLLLMIGCFCPDFENVVAQWFVRVMVVGVLVGMVGMVGMVLLVLLVVETRHALSVRCNAKTIFVHWLVGIF